MAATKKAPNPELKAKLKYPPYVNASGPIPTLFAAIAKASVPPKFSQDFMSTVLDMKSSSHRALIPLLKRLGFLDLNNVPTESYKRMRDDAEAPSTMAARLREAYAELYRANEYAHTLSREDVIKKLKSILGAADDDEVIPYVASTFKELTKLADFDANPSAKIAKREQAKESDDGGEAPKRERATHARIGLSYTINLNLPATTEVEVFNAIFRALKEHILDVD